MDQFWYDLLVMVLQALVPVAVLVVGVLIKRYFEKKGATEEQLILIDTAYSYLTKAVVGTNQTWVDALKASSGKLTQEQQEVARQKTVESFKEMLTDSVKLAIEAAYGSVEKWLDLTLEPAVGEVKILSGKVE